MAFSRSLLVAATSRTLARIVSRAAQPLELALLQHAQQLDLRRQVQLADLVEEQRAALGQLEAALLRRVGAGERAFLVAEQLRLDQILRQRRAADLDERLLRPRRVVVDGVGDQLLAGARLAAQQHRRVGAARPAQSARRPAASARSCRPGSRSRSAPSAPSRRCVFSSTSRCLIGLDQPVHLHRLRDHRADDAEELRRCGRSRGRP